MNSPYLALAAYYLGVFILTSVAVWVTHKPDVMLLALIFVIFAPTVSFEKEEQKTDEVSEPSKK